MTHTVDEVVELVLTHPGHGFRCIDDDVLTAFILYEWESGRWSGIHDPDSGQINGWISWYNFDQNSLEEVQGYGLPGCFRHSIHLTPGNHCYISNVVVRVGQPKGSFRMLWNMACLRNPHAYTFNAHLCNRPAQEGKPHWRWFSRRNRKVNKFLEVRP